MPAETAAIARAIASDAPDKKTILLDGPVGAGKSHFARAFIRARLQNPAEDVPSPTFTLVQSYLDPAGIEIWHADLYRLTHRDEVEELGLIDALDTGICLIEWPDRMGRAPDHAMTISLEVYGDPERRNIVITGPRPDPMITRAVERAKFIAGAGWADAEIVFLAGDASARRYFRLYLDGETAVLMDAPPASCDSYVAMTAWLRDRGFLAPDILARDLAAGLILMADLGDDLVARVVQDYPERARDIYPRIADLLADLHDYPPAPGIAVLDGPALAEQVGLFAEFYAPAAGAGSDVDLGPVVASLYDALCADQPLVTALRDFHAENILVCDGRLGLLDFQDAVAAHPAYDLVSVLHDARHALPIEIEEAALQHYLDRSGLDADRFRAAFALLGAQRNLRIMGIFTRLCLRDGKARYLDFMPHLWDLITRELRHPALAPLADLVTRIPGPSPEIIERIRAQCPSL